MIDRQKERGLYSSQGRSLQPAEGEWGVVVVYASNIRY